MPISELNRWCKYIPLLHQVLSGSRSIDDFPSPTQRMDLFESCAVWETLHYLCLSLLGWQSPAHGMAWWYENSQPTEDSLLLSTLKKIWGIDDAVDYYAAWLWSTADPNTGKTIEKSLLPPDAWWDALKRRPSTLDYSPYGGGYNPLHLGYSQFEHLSDSPVKRKDEVIELYFEPEYRRGVLIVPFFGCWREELAAASLRLPKLINRSWRISLFDRQIGFLGEFRQSRVTGKWFQGRHEIHMAGNPTF
jgi:hypothetical protein